MKLKRYLFFINILIFIIMIYSIYQIILWFNDLSKTKSIINEIEISTNINQKDTIIKENDKIITTIIDVDLNELRKINNDTVGWIKIDDTNINYPIVQSTNNDFYLNHSFNKTENNAGWVFMDYRNNSNKYDKNTIIYAHNRKDKTMFGTLKKLLKNNWYHNKTNNIIKISTIRYNTLWQIFSIYTIDNTNDYLKIKFDNNDEYQDFIEQIKNRSIKKFNTTITTKDKLLTLSTCHGSEKKLVVHAKLIKKEEK